jgi:hypothetical protein
MPHYIVLKSDKAENRQQAGQSLPSPVDNGASQLHIGSTFVRVSDGQRVPSPKVSDDKIVVGYSHRGLPFLIAVDGFFRQCDRDRVFQFIDDKVTPLIAEYIRLLEDDYAPESASTAFINALYGLWEDGQGLEFTLSVCATYEKNGALMCSSWGMGDIGFAVKRANGRIDQLLPQTVVNAFKDGFDRATWLRADRAEVIARNARNTLVVNPGDEIVGTTFLFGEMTRQLSAHVSPTGENVKRLALDIPQQTDATLFQSVSVEMERLKHQNIAVAQANYTQCGLIRMSSDPMQRLAEELVQQLDHHAAYALFENKLYFISSDGKTTYIMFDEVDGIHPLLALFPQTMDVLTQASEAELNQISASYHSQPSHCSYQCGDDSAVVGAYIPSLEQRGLIANNLANEEPVAVPVDLENQIRGYLTVMDSVRRFFAIVGRFFTNLFGSNHADALEQHAAQVALTYESVATPDPASSYETMSALGMSPAASSSTPAPAPAFPKLAAPLPHRAEISDDEDLDIRTPGL